MSATKIRAPRHARSSPFAIPAHSSAIPSGNVTTFDSGALPAIHTPNDADIYRAISELDKKLQQLSKNQKTIEARLNHIAARLDANNANLITGVQYLTKVMNSIGWWAAGDTDTAEETWPANPHWQ